MQIETATTTQKLKIVGITAEELAAAVVAKFNADNGTSYTLADFGEGEGDVLAITVKNSGVVKHTNDPDTTYEVYSEDREGV